MEIYFLNNIYWSFYIVCVWVKKKYILSVLYVYWFVLTEMNRFLYRLSRSINTEALTDELRPRRSVLYAPGANVKALNKLPKLKTDCVIMDLEDAVGPSNKVF